MSEKDLFYVDVEERSFITLAVEAEDDAEAEELAEAYVAANVFPSEMSFSDRTAMAYTADEQPAMAVSAVSITREVDPFSAVTRDFKRTIEGYIGRQELSAEDILGAANSVLEEIENEVLAKPVAKMGV